MLPNYFPLWLSTCKWNPTIDFFIITDDRRDYEYPNNVKKVYMEFTDLQKMVQKSFEFPISLETPYKLCDYKPAYGEIFSHWLKDYDYWGYCDIDLFWGNIRKYVTDEILSSYKRIFSRGHCSIFLNNKEVNSYYRTLPNFGCLRWNEVYQSPKSYCFDEWAGHCGGGISQIMKLNKIPIFDGSYFADLNVMKGKFDVLHENNKNVGASHFHVYNGTLKSIGNRYEKEYLYCHFQKRQIIISNPIDVNDFYFIAPNLVTSDKAKIKRYLLKEIHFDITKIKMKFTNKILSNAGD